MTWKIIDGYEYSINEYGQIKNNRTNKLLSMRLSNGYNRVRLYKNSVGRNILVHRLVAEKFCIKYEGFDEVNHKDGNKLNNHYTNLEWSNRSLNQIHKCYVLGKTIKNINLTKNGEIYEFVSLIEASNILGLDRGNLSRLLGGQRKSLNGYKKIN